MKTINLGEISFGKLEKILGSRDEVFFIAERKFDTNLLKAINEQCSENIELSLRPNEKGISIELLKLIPNIQRLNISPADGSNLETLDGLSDLTNLVDLTLGMYVKGNVSFEPIKYIKTLRQFNFVGNGLEHKSQYEFVNQQLHLEKLHIKKLDLSLLVDMPSLIDLRIHSTLKNEHLLVERFPNLKKFHLHGESRRQDHSFICNLPNVENITINYNGYLTTFPKMKSPEKVKSICMLECPNFSDIDSLLVFENLETLCLTTYNKSLQLPVEDFPKLKQLKKLKTVYTAWGRGKESEIVEKVYKETKWKNSMI